MLVCLFNCIIFGSIGCFVCSSSQIDAMVDGQLVVVVVAVVVAVVVVVVEQYTFHT